MHTKVTCAVILALFLYAWPASAQKSPELVPIHRLDGTTITTDAAEVFAAKTLAAAHVTGAQIVVMDKGKVVWSAAFGSRKFAPVLPMDRETTTWAASLTKSVFATYVMQLVERDEFHLDIPIATLLPKPLDAYDAYHNIASELVHDPAWSIVTPRMLLAHTSGLANFASLEPDKKMHLHAKPGVQFRYSGEGINLLQFVIEQQKGKPLDQLMQEALFTPLGMTRTGLIYRPEFASDVADRYDAQERFHAETRRSAARAAGSMTTSAEDMGRFAAALFAGQVLKPESRRVMFTPVIPIRSLHQFPFSPDENGDEARRIGLAYGLGWGLLTSTHFGPAFFKEGHGDGAQNYMIFFERRQAGMIILTNSDNGELAFRPLLETILGDTVTPWEWESYTPALIEKGREHQ